jgi:hypothetical protein
MTDLTNIRTGDVITVLPKKTDFISGTHTATVRIVVPPNQFDGNGGIWTHEGRFIPANRIA